MDNQNLLVLDDRTFQIRIHTEPTHILYAVFLRTNVSTDYSDVETAVEEISQEGGKALSVTIEIPIAWMPVPPVNPIVVDVFGIETELTWIKVKSGHFILFDLPGDIFWKGETTVLEISVMAQQILAATYEVDIDNVRLTTASVMSSTPKIYRSSMPVL